jgi:hypothetical protein
MTKGLFKTVQIEESYQKMGLPIIVGHGLASESNNFIFWVDRDTEDLIAVLLTEM